MVQEPEQVVSVRRRQSERGWMAGLCCAISLAQEGDPPFEVQAKATSAAVRPLLSHLGIEVDEQRLRIIELAPDALSRAARASKHWRAKFGSMVGSVEGHAPWSSVAAVEAWMSREARSYDSNVAGATRMEDGIAVVAVTRYSKPTEENGEKRTRLEISPKVLAHELCHASDFVRYPGFNILTESDVEDEALCVSVMLAEGHARLVQYRIPYDLETCQALAKCNSALDMMADLHSIDEQGPLLGTTTTLRTRGECRETAEWEDGWRLFEWTMRHGGRDAVTALLEQPPTSYAQVHDLIHDAIARAKGGRELDDRMFLERPLAAAPRESALYDELLPLFDRLAARTPAVERTDWCFRRSYLRGAELPFLVGWRLLGSAQGECLYRFEDGVVFEGSGEKDSSGYVGTAILRFESGEIASRWVRGALGVEPHWWEEAIEADRPATDDGSPAAGPPEEDPATPTDGKKDTWQRERIAGFDDCFWYETQDVGDFSPGNRRVLLARRANWLVEVEVDWRDGEAKDLIGDMLSYAAEIANELQAR